MLWTLCYYLVIFYVVIQIFGIWYKKTSGRYHGKVRMDGKTVIITGASAGIGKATAVDLAKRGAKLILACRNLEKAERVAKEVIAKSDNKNVKVRKLDVSDLESVRAFAKQILAEESALHVLLNNAGAMFTDKQLTKEELELTFVTNHLGHFLLTNLLLDLMRKSAPARIINVSSLAHKMPGFDINDLQFKKRKYNYSQAYAQSKLCNVLFTRDLHRKLLGCNITVNSLHPGVVRTEFADNKGSSIVAIFKYLSMFAVKDPKLGAQTNIYLAVADELQGMSGLYFADCEEKETSTQAQDAGLAKKLWEISEDLCDLKPHEKHYYQDSL